MVSSVRLAFFVASGNFPENSERTMVDRKRKNILPRVAADNTRAAKRQRSEEETSENASLTVCPLRVFFEVADLFEPFRRFLLPRTIARLAKVNRASRAVCHAEKQIGGETVLQLRTWEVKLQNVGVEGLDKIHWETVGEICGDIRDAITFRSVCFVLRTCKSLEIMQFCPQ